VSELNGDKGILAVSELNVLAKGVDVSIEPYTRVFWSDATIRLNCRRFNHHQARLRIVNDHVGN
jgi:hypothetical protein